MIRSITPKQAFELLSRGDVDLVDVREPSEWSEGHMPGARLVPLSELRARTKASLPRDAVIFVCAAGMRSETAARLAAAAGITTVYSVSGGIRSWAKAGLPVVKDALSA